MKRTIVYIDGYNALVRDYEFAFPSDAIAIIRGTSASNLRQWVSVVERVPMDLFDRTVLKNI